MAEVKQHQQINQSGEAQKHRAQRRRYLTADTHLVVGGLLIVGEVQALQARQDAQ